MKRLLVLLTIILPALSTSAAEGGFLFTTFKDETTPMSEQIYMGISEDGRHWDALSGGNPVLVSNVGERGVRDSFLLRSHDGQRVWLIATDLCIARNRDWKRATHAGSRSVVVWESSDLVHWELPRLAVVAPSDAGCVWAPEAIYDEDAGDYWCNGLRQPLATNSPSSVSGRPAPRIFARSARRSSMSKRPIM